VSASCLSYTEPASDSVIGCTSAFSSVSLKPSDRMSPKFHNEVKDEYKGSGILVATGSAGEVRHSPSVKDTSTDQISTNRASIKDTTSMK
jgi:hypothetical protein